VGTAALAPIWGSLSGPPVSAFRWCREDRLVIGRVRRLSRSSHHGGAPGEHQDHEERGHPPPQEH